MSKRGSALTITKIAISGNTGAAKRILIIVASGKVSLRDANFYFFWPPIFHTAPSSSSS